MRGAFLLLSLMVMTACTPLWQKKPLHSPEQLWSDRLQSQSTLTQWAFRGRTAVTQGREGWNAGVDWEQQDTTFAIKLLGPFAQGGVMLAGNDDEVTLTLDNGEQISSESPERLLAESLGWLLPVSALRDWLRGIPFSQLPVERKTLDTQGRLTHLTQDGWDIEIKAYMPFESYSMPAKVAIKHEDLSVKVIVTDWRRP